MIQKSTNIYDFAYSVGAVRTLEALLLNENELERMVLAENAKDAFRILNETDYADNQDQDANPEDFQKIIDEGLLQIRERLEQITPDKRILNILWMGYDFHNIKTLLKAKLAGMAFEDVENLLSKMGKIDIIKLKNFIYDNEISPWGLYEKTEKNIKKRIRQAEELFEKSGQNPQVIDLFLDQKLMKIIFHKAEDSKSKFLIDYVRLLIDLSNIKLFFRMQATGKDLQMYEFGFLWNGTNTWSKMSEAFKLGLDKFPEFMKSSKYSKIINEGYKRYKEENTLIFLEKEIENYLTNYIQKAKLIPFGPEPLIAYFLAKRNNALIIRMILINKLNQIDPEEIQERLRKLYS